VLTRRGYVVSKERVCVCVYKRERQMERGDEALECGAVRKAGGRSVMSCEVQSSIERVIIPVEWW
jgi:hypothetical protein